ncbi:hypothetical protein JT31_01905 [Cedecea neteri]|uniref:Uncharacterized protein n=1 Tax=Cedecea neteri TaxID=158822 RepID=A0A089PWY0_9ENTR|nr:hypothetical protein JT31_01905 [Cedecea neteri]
MADKKNYYEAFFTSDTVDLCSVASQLSADFDSLPETEIVPFSGVNKSGAGVSIQAGDPPALSSEVRRR